MDLEKLTKQLSPLIVTACLALVILACSVSFRGKEEEQPTVMVAPTQAVAQQQAPTEAPPPAQAPTTPAQPTAPSAEAASAPGLQVISHTSFDDGDYRYIVGVLQNNTDVAVSNVEINISLLDNAGEAIDTTTVTPPVEVIPPTGRAPFSTSSDQWGEVASYEIELSGTESEMPAEKLQITSSTSYDDGDWLYLIGNVKNVSDTAISWVGVSVALFDANDQVLNVSYNFTMLDIIPPGESTPFSINLTNNWQGTARYELFVNGSEDVLPEPVVELASSNSYQDESGWCYTEGEVKNIGSEPLDFITVVVGFYDASNNLVGTGWTFADSDSLAPGAIAPFSVSTYRCPDFDHAVVQVEG